MKLPGFLKIYGIKSLPVLAMAAVFFLGSSTAVDNPDLPETTSAEYYPSPYFFSDTMSVESNMLIIPLKNAGRFYLIEAVIDNQQGNLIFDTGATELVLNSTYFRKYLKKGEKISQGITGIVGQADRITTWNMIVSGLRYYKTDAIVSDLSHIENKCGVKVLGLFGFGLIKNFEIVIDFARNELQLYRIDRKGDRLSAQTGSFKGDYTQKLEESKNIVFLNCTMAGKALRFCLDTGAETNALDIHCPDDVLQTVSIKSRTSLSGAGTEKTEVLFGMMKEFRLGDNTMKNMPTIITNLASLEEAYNKEMHGMLGYDFLIRGSVCINFVKGQFDMKILK